MSKSMRKVHVIDSHTGGEPTRVVLSGGPDLGDGSVEERRERLRDQHDEFRRSIILEPRGTDYLVGALLMEPSDPTCDFGVIFFDNVTYIGMCGHGTIGFVNTLAYLDRIQPGIYRIETPVGVVVAKLNEDFSVSVTNVPSYRQAKQHELLLEDGIRIRVDIAWAGNWFAIASDHGQKLEVANLDQLTQFAWQIRLASNRQGYDRVDHIVLWEGLDTGDANAKNFVLCPGKAYDRSPCGTGTSAILAGLAADDRLKPGEAWIQESIVGSRFRAEFTWSDKSKGIILPTITGRAYMNAEATLLIEADDPFANGIAG
jgi:4-hydroxyproline epimerase